MKCNDCGKELDKVLVESYRVQEHKVDYVHRLLIPDGPLVEEEDYAVRCPYCETLNNDMNFTGFREASQIQPKLDWKSLLRDHITSNMPGVTGEEICIAVALDTSGSVSELAEFVAEVKGIREASPIKMPLWKVWNVIPAIKKLRYRLQTGDIYRDALMAISVCRSHHPGDVVDIARQTLRKRGEFIVNYPDDPLANLQDWKEWADKSAAEQPEQPGGESTEKLYFRRTVYNLLPHPDINPMPFSPAPKQPGGER